jgi:hypothetical protein
MELLSLKCHVGCSLSVRIPTNNRHMESTKKSNANEPLTS